jgi:hypothetical protein
MEKIKKAGSQSIPFSVFMPRVYFSYRFFMPLGRTHILNELGASMQSIRDRSMRQILRYCRRNLLFAHLTDKADRRERWPDWAESFEAAKARDVAGGNRLSVALEDVARFLAITAAVYLLVVFVVGIL